MSFSPDFLKLIAELQERDDATAAQIAAERQQAEHDRKTNDKQIAAQRLAQAARERARNEQAAQILATAKAVGSAAVARRVAPDVKIATKDHWWSKPVVQFSGWLLPPPLTPSYPLITNSRAGFFLEGSGDMYVYQVYDNPPPHYQGNFHVLRNRVVIGTTEEIKLTSSAEDGWTTVARNIYGSETLYRIDAGVLASQYGCMFPPTTDPESRRVPVIREDFSYMLARFALNNRLVTP